MTNPAGPESGRPAPAITSDILARLAQATVLDADGRSLGAVGQIYLSDADGTPTWVTVRGDAGREMLVPVHGQDVSQSPLQVQYTAAVIEGAPRVAADGHISQQEELNLHEYYRSHGWTGAAATTEGLDEPTPAQERAGFAATQPVDETVVTRDAGLSADPDRGADHGADAGAGYVTDPDRGADGGADAGAGDVSDPDRGADGGADAGADRTAAPVVTERADGVKEFDGIPVIDVTDPDLGADAGTHPASLTTDPDHGADHGADAGAGYVADPDHGADHGADAGADRSADTGAEARPGAPVVTERADGVKEFDGIPVIDATDPDHGADHGADAGADTGRTGAFRAERTELATTHTEVRPVDAHPSALSTSERSERHEEHEDHDVHDLPRHETFEDGYRLSGPDEVRDGGYGWGSAAPLGEGVQPLGHPVRAWEDTRSYRQGPSAFVEREPDVWFVSPEAAEAAGFHQAENWV